MAEKHEGGVPAVHPVRMDQEFQLQNLRRLAMDPEFESMGQYASAYSSPAKGQEDVSSNPDPSKSATRLAVPLTRRPDCFVYVAPRCLWPEHPGAHSEQHGRPGHSWCLRASPGIGPQRVCELAIVS